MGKSHRSPETTEQPNDPLARDKLALRKSQAGMRFIAQMHIYNSLNWDRMLQFISDSYHIDLLDLQSAEERLPVFQELHEQIGRVKVKQVVGTNENTAIVVIESEMTEHYYYAEIQCEEEYPHKITHFIIQQMRPAEGSPEDAAS